MWHTSVNIAYKDDTKKAIEVVSDDYGFRFVYGNSAEWYAAIRLPKIAAFMNAIGIVVTPELPENVASYTFRFSAITTNGSINVLGSNDALVDQVVTNDLQAVMADLNADEDFVNYMSEGNWLENALTVLNDSYAQVTALVPSMYAFWDDTTTYGDSSPTYRGIEDGGDDMYDGANYLNTDLTQVFALVDNGDVDGNDELMAACIPYTHTQSLNEDDNNEYLNPPMDGAIQLSDGYFGPGSRYFTNMYPGLFILAADNININEFSVSGNIGADGSGVTASTVSPIGGKNWTLFFKSVDDEGNDDPTINQLILVPGSSSGLTQYVPETTNDDDHAVFGLSGRSRILYAVVATNPDAGPISESDAVAIATKILDLIPGS